MHADAWGTRFLHRSARSARFTPQFGPPSPDGFGAASMKLTYDDFLLFPDDGKRHELIDGEH